MGNLPLVYALSWLSRGYLVDHDLMKVLKDIFGG